jgi:DNA polymerase sigma
MAPNSPEYSVVEQNKTLEEFAKRIIADATPRESEMTMKRKLLARCKEICTRVYSQAELVPFGSLVSECFPGSITHNHVLLDPQRASRLI